MVIDPKERRRAHLIAVGTAALSFVLGLSGLAGWLLDSVRLKTGFTSRVSIKANAALCLCIAAWALLAQLGAANARWARVARGAGALIALLGAVTLSEHLFTWDAGIDQLLFAETPGAIGTMSPGRMGPPACVGFLLIGLGLLLIEQRTRRGRSPSQWLSLPVMAIGTLGVLGYLTGASQLYGIARYTGIALNMAIGLLSLSVALFLARPTVAPASILIADNAGGQLARTMLPTTILVPIALGWLRTEGQRYGLYDTAFGRALLLLSMIVTFTAVAWRMSVRLSGVATARALAEQASTSARAEAERLALENVRTLSVLDSLLTHAPIGLVFFDRARRCVRINDFLARMEGESRDSAVGGELERALPGTGAGVQAAIARVFERGESTTDLELTQLEQAGESTERSWLLGIFPVGEGRGEITLAGAFVIEITERRRLEAQRAALLESERAARSEAERAANLKDQFLATVSHELRTPLNAIMGWAVVAQRSAELPAALQRPLEIIVRNARAQAQLIDDLLDVSRIVSGKMKLELEPVRLADVVDAAVLSARPAADAKQLQLHAELQPSVSVLADPARLQQIIGNLLSNAIKFTPKGGQVELTARLSGGRVEVCVHDQGVGIKPEFLPHVFDRFRQADSTTTRRHGGLGLGLTIVKQLTELHGGQVRVESAGEGRGSTFIIALPLAHAPGALAAPEQSAPSLPAHALTGCEVLVVDDESDAREFVARVLTEHRASVAVAEGVDEALELLARRSFHLLVSDIGMPDRDGYELIAEVRQRFSADLLPAVAVTAFARADDRRRALAAGFQQHLVKPVDPYELTRAAVGLLAAARSSRVEAEPSASTSLPSSAAAKSRS